MKQYINNILTKILTLTLLLLAGGIDTYGQTDYSGTYYIASGGKGEKNNGGANDTKYTYNSSTPVNNFYLCPTEGWCYYKPDNDFSNNGTSYPNPFLTTYKCRDGVYDATKAVWTLEKAPAPNSGYYYIRQTNTGKYLFSNGQIRTTDNADRIRVHLEKVTDELDEKALFAIEPVSGQDYVVIRIVSNDGINGNNKWLSVCFGNYNNLVGNEGKTGGPKDDNIGNYYYVAGIVCIYTQGDANAPFYLEDYITRPIITYNDVSDEVTINAVQSGATLIYTTDGSIPTTSNGIPVDNTTITFSPSDGATTIKAVAVVNGELSNIATFKTPVFFGSNHKYLIQSQNNGWTIDESTTDFHFYMIPGDEASSVLQLNTTSLFRPTMEWHFMNAGIEGSVQYYYIINSGNSKYLCYDTTNKVYMDVFGSDANKFKFSIVESDIAGTYLIKPYGQKNNLNKNNGNNNASVINLSSSNTAENAHWKFVASSTLDKTAPFVASGASSTSYYKIASVGSNGYYIIPGTPAVTSNTSGENTKWYLEVAQAANASDWLTYYYIRNAVTCEYLYFTKDANNAGACLEMRSEIEEGSEDRYMFTWAKTADANANYYIIPKNLKDVSQNQFSSLRKHDTNTNILTNLTRNAANFAWTFDATTFKCETPVISYNPLTGKVSITCGTAGVTIYFAHYNSEPSSSDIPELIEANAYNGEFDAEPGYYKAVASRSTGGDDMSDAVTSEEIEEFHCMRPIITKASNHVTITCATPGATIYYIVGNGEFSESAANYGGTLYPDGGFDTSGTVIKAIAVKGDVWSTKSAEALYDKTPTTIISGAQIINMDGVYIVGDSFEPSSTPIGSATDPFTGEFNGNFKEFELSHPLFAYVSGATIKNVIISKANNVSTTTNAGVIANVANGDSRIYNCGINSGSVTGSNYVGGIVGLLDGSARVINCYSYADVSGGSDKGGIVGYNNFASTSSDLRTMVMNCMFYGDISTDGNISPVYGGKNISNVSGGLNTFNYYRYESTYSSGNHITDGKYYSAIEVKEDFLVRIELYRNLLNSNKKLAAIYATGSADNAEEMAKWVLETADRTITSPKQYPILKKRENGKQYPSIINYDAKNAPTTGDRNQGKKLGTLKVKISESNTTTGGQTKPTGATVTTTQLILNRTDKDYGHYNFNYDKIQLPYYNDVGTKNYTKNKVVTGWKITSMTPTTGDGNATEEETFTQGDTWGGYNFADRKHYAKDLYAKNGNRIFSQGAYFDVPYGVTEITIEPYWGNAAYIADDYYDVIYTDDGNANTVYGSENVTALGTQFTNSSTKEINGDVQLVYTNLSTALETLEGSTVYDNALVLIGNRHLKSVPSNGDKAFTMMSIDLDNDNEPDYSLIYHHDNRQAVSPIRFDFLNVIGTAMAQKPQKPSAANASPKLYNVAIFNPKDWFEITNTCLIHFVQFEYDNGSKSSAPLILLGGVYDQFTSTHVATATTWNSATQYIHVGSNVYFKNFSNGCHGEVKHFTTHIPISATGGDYDGFYLSGIYMPDAVAEEDGGAECYISGGRFNEVAGAAQQQVNGDVQWQIYNADITDFYGGGLNAAQPITGDITTNIYNSNVTTFCGGPKFGDMAGVKTPAIATDDKTVTTNADGCTFTNFFGAGYGGTSYNTVSTKDGNAGLSADFGTWQADYTGVKGFYSSTNSGIATDFEYDSFVWSTGRPAGRFYVKYASFSLAQTNDVNSILKNCTITENFYGGGNRGKVNGKATSSLEDCTVTGNVFGAGYSASDATVDVRNGGFVGKVPRINLDTGLFEEGTLSGTTTYTWTQGTVSNGNSALGTVNSQNVIYTTENLATLGQVSSVDLTIKGNTTIGGSVFGGGAESATNGVIDVKIENGAITGNVYGGGDQGNVIGSPTITISKKNNSYPTSVTGSVFGGGNEASTTGNPNVSMTDGTVGYVYGGGLGSSAVVTGNTAVAISGGTVSNDVYGGGSQGAVTGTVSVTISGEDTHVTHDVYGGGALANTNTNVESYVVKAVAADSSVKGLYTESGGIYTEITDEDAVASDGTTYYEKVINTSVNLTGGTVRDVYGGGLGRQASEGVTAVAADVNGHVTVTVSGGTARKVFGCNNANGTPKESVAVTINGTAATVVNEGGKTYALQGVYGGGNLAHYDPTTPGNYYPTVTVNGCNTSIKDVFGGGNAAAVPYTNVTINGGDINRVFAGGNGESGVANVGYKNSEDSPSSGSYGAGTTNATIAGGTINEVYGGSNSKGTVRATGTMNITKSTAEGACPMKIGSVYGGGNEAPGAAVSLSIGCTGSIVEGENGHAAHPELIGTTLEGIGAVYGGANQADVSGDISMAINSGIIANVYGGNNTSGSISGSITVNIEKNAATCGWYLGNVYGGGNLAPYGGENDNKGDYPVVNIKNGTVSGNVYGGGKGSMAIVTGNPQVTIGDATDGYEADVTGDVYGGGDAAAVIGTPVVHVIKKDNTNIGNVYGGGNAADVTATSVTIDGGTIGMVFGGGHGDKNSDPVKAANVTGGVNMTVSGGTISKVFGGSNSKGTIGGAITMGIAKSSAIGASDMKIGEVYGGGNEAAGNAGTINIGCTGTWTTADDNADNNHDNRDSDHRIGYELEGIGTVYGGANAANVGNGITLNIIGGIVENVFGGNNTSGSIDGDITVNVEWSGTSCSNFLGNVYGGGNLAPYSQKTTGHPAVNIKNGTVSGSVYGGGKGSSAIVTGNPMVIIGDNSDDNYCAVVTGDIYGGGDAAAVKGSTYITYNDNNTSSTVGRLFGGGNAAGVSATSTVNLTSGKVTGGVYGGCNASGSVGVAVLNLYGGTVGSEGSDGDVFGGGLGKNTSVAGNVTVNVGHKDFTGSTATTIWGDVYGGSAMGSVNTNTENKTLVNLYRGIVNGDVFGGGLGVADTPGEGTEGSEGYVPPVSGAAYVKGDIEVDLNANSGTCVVTGSIFGCNNTNGSPEGDVEVHIYRTVTLKNDGTVNDKPQLDTNTYELQTVFGGGKNASYSTSGKSAQVFIESCDVSINEVYGGGYGADVNGTFVEVSGAYEIGTVFGGGYGAGQNNPGANVNGSTRVSLAGGRVHDVYGGSNSNGNVSGGTSVEVSSSGDCDLHTDNIYGGGRNAKMTGGVSIIMGCRRNDDYVAEIYGGAEEADIAGDVSLTITCGHYGKVFGGNKTRGVIGGTITVNIEETASCSPEQPVRIDELYGGGYEAAYVAPYESGTSGSRKPSPIVNIRSCTSIGKVFGGGYKAKVTGDPFVYVDQLKGYYSYKITGDNKLGTIGDIYGGGNDADVDGSTHVYIATKETTDFVTEPTERVPDTDNQGQYKAQALTPASTVSGKNFYSVEGANITGCVYGGGYGSNTKVTGDVDIQIGVKDGTTPSNVSIAKDVYGGSAMGKVNVIEVTDNSTEPATTSLQATSGSKTEVSLYGGTISGDLYGGGYGKNPDDASSNTTYSANVYGPVTVIVEGGGARNVFGCNNISGAPQSTVAVSIVGTKSVESGYAISNVFGGGNAAAYTGTPIVQMSGGKVENIFGGGLGTTATVNGSTSVTMSGGTAGYVFGGGSQAPVTGSSTVTLKGSATVNEDVFGGGDKADVNGSATVNIQED